MSLSVVLPCYNEAENVDAAVRGVLTWFRDAGVDGEVIAVNDGSSDGTSGVLARLADEGMPLRVVTHEKNQGYGAALSSGCDVAVNDFVVPMDGDGQFRASDIGKLLPLASSSTLVAGYRHPRQDGLYRGSLAFLYNALVRIAFGIDVRDVNCGMKLFPRAMWPLIRPRSTGGAFPAELLMRAKAVGMDIREAPVPHYPRLHGESTGARLSVIRTIVTELLPLWRERKSLLIPH